MIEELGKKHATFLESEIIEYMFDYYNYENNLRKKYEKYNLFELILILDNNIGCKCDLNKKNIIDLLIENKVDIQYYGFDENKSNIPKLNHLHP